MITLTLNLSMPNGGKNIAKLFFLIHPGFLTSPHSILSTAEERDRNATLLFSRYIKKATELREDELMLVFAHSNPTEFKTDLKNKERYVEMIRELRRILRKRLIVFFEDGMDDVEIERVARMISARGFKYNPEDVETEAGGETLGMCVENWSSALNVKLGLKKKTRVDTQTADVDTDGGWPAEKFFEEKVQSLKKEYDRLEWF